MPNRRVACLHWCPARILIRGGAPLIPTPSCLLHQVRRNCWLSKNNQRFANFAVRWFRKCKPFHRSAARRGKGISDSAAADLIASIAPLRTRTTKARPASCPALKSGFQRAASEPFGCSFPSFCQHRKGVPEGRKMSSAVRKYIKLKTYCRRRHRKYRKKPGS